ncbi:MAG: Trk family potassium uptake protein [Clostridia bacterium]|nr:Trk family potassium uptake protein [Clostridia bacterium]
MKTQFKSMQILLFGFAFMIFCGGALLWLPVSNHYEISFLDALFTATSAACVTGLVVYDTYSQFTFFGQAVLLLLIQVGGLGFMMIGISFYMFMGRRIGLRQRALLMESVGIWKVGGIVRLTKHVLIATVIIELCGALLLSTRFCPRFGIPQGLWYGLFHSISAFCNAGFDLMGKIEPYSSLTYFTDDILVNFTVCFLIVVGGLGFFLWNDLSEKKFQFAKYQLHTKIVLSVTAALIIGGTVAFYFLEENAAFAGLSSKERLLSSFFASITPRTAGFNTTDVSSLSEGGTLLTMILMVIGAGSGSTAGGIKVTTFAVLILSVISYARRQEDLNIFERRLEPEAIRHATSEVTAYMFLSLAGAFIICVQGFSLEAALFEAFSAIGTVGLSMGITSQLPALSKIVVMLLMYSGRIGSLSVAVVMSRRLEEVKIKHTSEKIIIG